MGRGPVQRGELCLLQRIRELLPPGPDDEVWIGDDAAVLRPPEHDLLLAIDTAVAGVHFDLDLMAVEDVGWRAVATNVSDIAAMGGSPWRAVASVASPAGTDMDGLFSGMAEAGQRYGCALVGGDLTMSTCLSVSVAVTGTTGGERAVLRSGARPGDAVFVSGRLGAAAAGLRVLREARGTEQLRPDLDERIAGVPGKLVSSYRRPEARLLEARAARAAGATAMIDVSDGFALDMSRIADASGVGLVIDEVPAAEGATLEEALYGGDDYELVFAAPDEARVAEVFGQAGLRQPLRVGTCTAEMAERRLQGGELRPSGWEHAF